MSTKESFSVKVWTFMAALIIETSLFSNNTTGWASLLVIMKSEGVYSDLCRDVNSRSRFELSNTTEPSTRACSKQEERFNFILTITWVVSLTASLIIGLLVDRFDVKIVKTLGSLLYCLGVGLLAFTSSAHPGLMLPGTILVHCGGQTLFLCSCRAATVFGKWQSLVLSILNGAMITSSVLFSILKMLYENGIGKRYLFISLACCNFLSMIFTLLVHPPLDNSNGPEPTSKLNKKSGDKLDRKSGDKLDKDTGSSLDEEHSKKIFTKPGKELHEDSGKKFSRDAWKKFSGESGKTLAENPEVFQDPRNNFSVDQAKSLTEDRGPGCVGANPKTKLGVNSREDLSEDFDENSQQHIAMEPTEARCIIKRIKEQVVAVGANHGGVKTEETVVLYQEDEIFKTRLETKKKSSLKKKRKTACSLLRLMASGGFLWRVVFVGLCRFRLLLFLTTFLQFIANQPGADGDTAKAYSDVWGLVQGGSLFVGPLLGLLITAGKDKGRMRSACVSCLCVFTKLLQLLKAKRSDSQLEHAHFSHGVKEDSLKRDSSSAQLACQDDQDEQSMVVMREIRGCLLSFSVNGFLLLAFGVSVLIPNVPTQVLSIVILTLIRVFYNGGISNMLLAIFPREHFGVLYATNCIAVVAVCTLQYPFFLVVEDCFHGDLFWPNVILLIASVGCLGLPVYLWRYMKRVQASTLAQGFTNESKPRQG